MAVRAEVLHRPAARSDLWSWITTVDHKRIGILYGVSAFAFFLIGGIEALIIRIQLAVPNNAVVSPDTFNSLFTMHGTTMIFLALMPLGAAMFNFLVPLMIGARDVAFPRLNALSFWIFLFGGLLLNFSWVVQRTPDVGWFAYANLTSPEFSPGPAVDFYVLGLQVLGIASLAAAFNFIVTIINLRAPGMSLMRMPLFVWNTLITNFLMIFAFPAITVALILLMFDRLFGTHFYIPSGGGDPVLWQHLFWIFGHPEVYILILPAMGVVSEVIPTFSRKPIFGYPFVVYASAAIAFLGFSVWAHHMFAVGMGPVADAAFATGTMLIAIPTGVKIFNWLGTMWGGALNLKTPMYFALGFIGEFTIGGLSGVMHASPPVDWQQTDTYFVVAHIHYVLFGGTMFGLFSGIYYWFPKVTGRLLDEGLGKAHFWLMFIGFNLTFFPMHFLGMDGMPRRVYTYPGGMGWDVWNLVATIGAFIIGVSILVFLANVFVSLQRGRLAGANPWDGATLEWSIPSPPPPYNFAVVPTVYGRDPLWADTHGPHGGETTSAAAAAPARTPSVADETGHGIHMPRPSFYPFTLALGMALAAGGTIAGIAAGLGWGIALIVIGVAMLFISIYGWAFQPAS